MSVGASTSAGGAALPVWRDPAAWARTADLVVVGIALALPWSTSLVAIFAVIWIIVLAPTLELPTLARSLKQPACMLPIAFFVLAVVGTLWSDAPWGARIYAISPIAKLLVLPLLLNHFGRSERGLWVFVAFVASCTLLMAMSWIVVFDPQLTIKRQIDYGVPVKNYIDQSQEFALCAVALAYPVVEFFNRRKFAPAAVLLALGLGFVVNMMFVVVSRTALVAIPVMLVVFALLHLKWRGRIVALCAIAVLAGGAWLASPRLQASPKRRCLAMAPDRPRACSSTPPSARPAPPPK